MSNDTELLEKYLRTANVTIEKQVGQLNHQAREIEDLRHQLENSKRSHIEDIAWMEGLAGDLAEYTQNGSTELLTSTVSWMAQNGHFDA